jgi:transcriptional regulator
MFLPAGEKQFEFWVLRRSGLPNINIAKHFGVSRQAVSRALLSMDKRIEETLLEMARANRIEVEKLDSKKGILFGKSVPFKANAIIFVSTKHGMQVWYEHDGECGSCERYRECIELLWDFADEMQLKLQSTNDPTKIADELFEKLKKSIE